MGFLGTTIFLCAVVQCMAEAQFNVLPVFFTDSVIAHERESQENAATSTSTENVHSVMISRLLPKTLQDQPSNKGELKSVDSPVVINAISRSRRSPGRQADIDSFLSELETDIRRTQHEKKNANTVAQAPSWSYKSKPATERPFWKRFGDSISSTYQQVKNKAKDIAKQM